MNETRRDFLRKGAASASVAAVAATGLSTVGSTPAAAATSRTKRYPDVNWPDDVQESEDTPKLCQWFSRFPAEDEVRRCRQAGVRGGVVTETPELPWDVETLRQDDEGNDVVIYRFRP